jgi:leucyl-tRNA synthetase
VAEELWNKLASVGQPSTIQAAAGLAYQPWPKLDSQLLVEDTLEIPVQVNGKVRDRILIAAEATEEQIKAAALASEKVKPYLEGKTIKKIIIVGKKLVNIAVA